MGQNGQAAEVHCAIRPALEPYCAAQAKQGKMDELSAGQASTLARNEAVIDKSMEELEELEEALCESIAESIRGRRSAAEKLPGAKKKKRCACAWLVICVQ